MRGVNRYGMEELLNMRCSKPDIVSYIFLVSIVFSHTWLSAFEKVFILKFSFLRQNLPYVYSKILIAFAKFKDNILRLLGGPITDSFIVFMSWIFKWKPICNWLNHQFVYSTAQSNLVIIFYYWLIYISLSYCFNVFVQLTILFCKCPNYINLIL